MHELQDQYKLTPLSQWGEKDADGRERRDVLEPIEPEQDPLGPFKTLNAMLEENPPPAHHDLVLNQFARIGIGPGLDLDAQPDAVKQGLIRAELIGMALLKEQFLSGDWANIVNGWRYPPPETGRYGDDFLLRAADQSLAGITTNDPAEAVYLVNFTDSDGTQAQRRQPLRAALRCRRQAARRLVLVARAVRNRHEPGREPGRPILDRRQDRRAEDRRRRRADDPSAGRVARRGRGSELAPDPRATASGS